jgi:hypothetical protein
LGDPNPAPTAADLVAVPLVRGLSLMESYELFKLAGFTVPQMKWLAFLRIEHRVHHRLR